MPASIGVNLRVTGHCRQGGRKYMEDFFSVAYQQTEDEKDLEYAFFGIYDGHGGAEAASFAKEHLMETIIKHKNFWSDYDEDVLRAIRDGYIATHYAMWREQEKWPRTASGLPSTAGTTASVAFIRRGKIYIGHVGDSGITLGYQEPGSMDWKAKALTKDHKPENADELARIRNCGGNVVAKSGVHRVVWNRPKLGHQGPVRRSTPIDEIPFLAVARSLGDLWSYNYQSNSFIVSPDPDCSVLKIDTEKHRCLIFGTDGLYNMLSPSMAVHIVQQVERRNENAALSDSTYQTWLNPSKLLVERALDRWHMTKVRADNTSVVTLMLDPPGPPRAQVLKDRKKNLPETGLKIMTRFDDSNARQSANEDHEKAASENAGETSSQTILEAVMASPPSCSTAGVAVEGKNAAENMPPVSSSSLLVSFPLKERNFFSKTRESTSFDPRELTPKPSDNIEKENQKSPGNRLDDTIQCNEVSSSNLETDSACAEEDEHLVVKNARRSLRIGKKEQVTPKNKAQEEPKVTQTTKRKLEQTPPQPRKSLRLDTNSKRSEEAERKAFQAEEKLKRLAEKADLAKLKSAESPETKKKRGGVLHKRIGKKRIQSALDKMRKKSAMLRSGRAKANLEKKKKYEKVFLTNQWGKLVKEKKPGEVTRGGKLVDKKTSKRGKAGSSNVADNGNARKSLRSAKVEKGGSCNSPWVVSLNVDETSKTRSTLRSRLQQTTESLKKNVMRKK